MSTEPSATSATTPTASLACYKCGASLDQKPYGIVRRPSLTRPGLRENLRHCWSGRIGDPGPCAPTRADAEEWATT